MQGISCVAEGVFVFGATVSRGPGTALDEWSARRKTSAWQHTQHLKRHTSMPLVGFEPTISAGERPQTYTLDRAATGVGSWGNVSLWKGLCFMELMS
jgi:hypothetical protein